MMLSSRVLEITINMGMVFKPQPNTDQVSVCFLRVHSQVTMGQE